MTVGTNIPHDSAKNHVTGRSIFIDDRSITHQEVFVLPVGVPAAAGIVKSIELNKALSVEGILHAFTAKDFIHNRWGVIVEDQPILVEREIGYYGEPCVLLVGISREALFQARSLVHFEIEKHSPILSLKEALEKQEILYTASPLSSGDVKEFLEKSPYTLKGCVESGGQEHFYLESQASIAYPLEEGQIEVHSSSQHPSEVQQIIAKSLGLSLHQVVCVVKRMGGGFGGKESQATPFAAMASLVAYKTGLAARLILSKDDDMVMTGKRHPFKNFYEVGFDEEGKILALKAKLVAEGGAYLDLSGPIVERAMFNIEGAYYIPNLYVEGIVCRTNFHSNTAFRGFGAPQGTLMIESLMEDIASFLKKDSFEIRKRNCYGKEKNTKTPYGQELRNNTLPDLFTEIEKKYAYQERRKQVEKFNNEAKEKGIKKVRGLSMTATKFGIAFTTRFLNQGNALVNVHRDGTVQVSTGATEMGQGVNTKLQQIVAHAFGLSPSNVRIMATSTEKNHNTSPTAASSGSDLNGSAALKAVTEIKYRLSWVFYHLILGTEISEEEGKECPNLDKSFLKLEDFDYKDGRVVYLPTGNKIKWTDLVTTAYFNRVSLGEYAHFKTEGLGFDKNKGKGTPFSYFTNGVALSEVEVDCWTGEMKVLQVDILMDIGRSLNLGIDRGQVSGAFIQGMGWVSLENLFYDSEGKLLTHSPTTYKIPTIQDTPRVFTISFIENENNEHNIHRSKAVGEPPFLLGISVWTAIKDALRNYTAANKNRPISLKVPAIPEEILKNLEKDFSS